MWELPNVMPFPVKGFNNHVAAKSLRPGHGLEASLRWGCYQLPILTVLIRVIDVPLAHLSSSIPAHVHNRIPLTILIDDCSVYVWRIFWLPNPRKLECAVRGYTSSKVCLSSPAVRSAGARFAKTYGSSISRHLYWVASARCLCLSRTVRRDAETQTLRVHSWSLYPRQEGAHATRG